MSFSICARTGDAYGVAVAGHVLAAGTLAAAARPGIGSVCVLASPTTTRESLLAVLESGADPQEALDHLGDATGVIGLVGRHRAATRINQTPGAIAGSRVGGDEHTGYAIVGQYIASDDVLDAMERTFVESPHLPLVERLVAALAAGDTAGGDARGRQSACVVAVEDGAGIDGGALLADLRVDDHEQPVAELARLVRLNELYYGPRRQVLPLAGELRAEVAERLERAGLSVDDDDVEGALAVWAGPANLRRRLGDDGIDARLLQVLREATVVHPADHPDGFPSF